MKSEDTIELLQTGWARPNYSITSSVLTQCPSLLQTPFDYSQAFDHALKEIVGALPNRPPKESAADVVRNQINRIRAIEC